MSTDSRETVSLDQAEAKGPRDARLVFPQEIATYRRELPALLEAGKAGQYALIKGQQILGIWSDYQSAAQTGRERFGLEPICVKKIDPRDADRLALLDAS